MSSKTVELYAFITSEPFKQLVEQVEAQAGKDARTPMLRSRRLIIDASGTSATS